MIEDNKIDLDKNLIDKVSSLEVQRPKQESTSVKVREQYQYGTELSIDEKLYDELLALSKYILSNTKVIIEE